MRVPSGRRMCWAISLGTGKAPLSGSVKSSSESSVELTAVGEEGVVEGGVKVEVGAWKHVPIVRDSCLVQPG